MALRKRAPVLYPRNRSAQLDETIFRNPPAEYRGAPFWSWNSKVDIPQLFRQIEQFKQMGFGGFTIHSRTGLATEYLGSEFMEAVRACTEKAAKEGMLSWLYDEDRWPSGSAGGIVTRDRQYRIKHLLWTNKPYAQVPPPARLADYTAAARTENGTLLARYEIVLKDGLLARYRRLRDSEPAPRNARVWYAYVETPFESAWFNYQTYADTFSREAISRFIEVTHERFFETVGNHFGRACPAIFADEPQFIKKSQFNRADETRDLFMPWTPDFPETFKQAYKQDLLDHLPELFWNLPDNRPSLARYRYHDHTAERFAEAFGDTIGRWCEKHGVALTGHMLGEASLTSQTRGVGEVMRAPCAFHIPGLDILCDKFEFTTAKQSQSVARQFGHGAVLSEMYGVTNWDFNFLGHKAQGDWQAAMGVTIRVPHLAWQSMAGESKRDYPAAIGYQSPWYREYSLIEDHFARVNAVMSRGKPLVRVAVIHPIESSWLSWGPIEQNGAETRAQEEAFEQLPQWLLYGGIDFDYVSEALLPKQGGGVPLLVGEMRYDAVVVPAMRTIRSTTLKRLTKFKRSRGSVIFAGPVPALLDAKPSLAPSRLAKRCHCVGFNQREILDALAPFREISFSHRDGSPADSILHQIRIDGRQRHIFMCNTDRLKSRDNARVAVKGKWAVTLRDTASGELRPTQSVVDADTTTIQHSFEAAGHLLMTLSKKGTSLCSEKEECPLFSEISRLNDPVPVTLSEPNVLLLDQAHWRIDGRDWQPVEEILRLDNLARQQLNLSARGGRIAQPWADGAPAPVVAQLQLRFVIQSEIEIAAPKLALEEAEAVEIHLNRLRVPSDVTGWWVDESIATVNLPSISPGTHELVLTIPFTRKTNVEWSYLLGDFGVSVAGRRAKLIAPVRALSFGDWSQQGLPFYAGNVTYHCAIQGNGREALIEVAKFKNPLLSVDLDGARAGKIAFPPYRLNFGRLSPGPHKLDITAFGNRVNAFGAVHNADESHKWFGPEAWRSEGSSWSYEYQPKRMGILSAPILKAGAQPG